MPRSVKPVSAVVFDLDNTLVQSGSLVLQAFKYALEPFGLSLNFEELESLRAKTPKELFRDYLLVSPRGKGLL